MPIILDCKPLLNDWFPGSFPKVPCIPCPEPLPDHAGKTTRSKAPVEVLPCGMVDLRGAAAYLGIPPHAVRRLCRLKILDKFVRTNRTTWRFRIADLDDYLKRFTFQGKRPRP